MRGTFKAAAELFEDAASKLSLGVLPDADLERSVSEVRVKHEEFSRVLTALAERMGLEPPTADSPNSFSDFEKLITGIEAAQKALDDRRRKLQEVCSTLDLVLKLERKDGREFPSLRHCQDAARMLQNQFADTKTDLDDETNGKVHAFETLLFMVQNGKGISEEESGVAYDEISRVFGTPLVLAIERGLIVFPVVPSAEHGEETKALGKAPDETETEPILSEPRRLGYETVPAGPGRSEALVSKGEPIVGAFLLPVTKGNGKEKSRTESGAHSEPIDDASFRLSAGRTTQMVALELSASESEPSQADIERLAWLALSDQKLSAAYHLVGCFERLQPNSTMSISSPLVRAFALGMEIRQPHDHIATQLKADFVVLLQIMQPRSSRLIQAHWSTQTTPTVGLSRYRCCRRRVSPGRRKRAAYNSSSLRPPKCGGNGWIEGGCLTRCCRTSATITRGR